MVINKNLVCLSIILIMLTRLLHDYIPYDYIYAFCTLFFVILNMYCWEKTRNKLVVLSFSFMALMFAVPLVWSSTSVFENYFKFVTMFLLLFISISLLLIKGMKESDENGRKILKFIMMSLGGVIFLLCAGGYALLALKS
ncbi:hypothetical protein [Selenomonas sp. FC4001]|uniref:hypothetical protein n=1 Tax=Selenomonas sp. FC4001 TaxID=1408313 RepID=UPI0005654897|nr:hypothetical protein [Selenomonas sp. FC4001]